MHQQTSQTDRNDANKVRQSTSKPHSNTYLVTVGVDWVVVLGRVLLLVPVKHKFLLVHSPNLALFLLDAEISVANGLDLKLGVNDNVGTLCGQSFQAILACILAR